MPIRPQVRRPPLFCVHPAGGTVFCYLELAKHLSRDVPLYGLQAQGIDGELPPHDTVAAMAERYVRAIKVRAAQRAIPRLRLVDRRHHRLRSRAAVARPSETRLPWSRCATRPFPSPGEAFGEGDVVPLLALLFPGEDAQHGTSCAR